MTAAQARSLVRLLRGQPSDREVLVDGAEGWALIVELPALAPVGAPIGPRWRIECDGSCSALNGQAKEYGA